MAAHMPGVSDSGVPYQTVPATFWKQLPPTVAVPASVHDCGYAVNAPGLFPDLTTTNCFADAFERCTPAMLQYTMYTIEGDPIAWALKVEVSGTGCRMSVRVDSRDNFGDKGIWEGYCEQAERQAAGTGRARLVVEHCSDEHLGVGLPL
ncbi:MAG TPA: hypothetical protein VLA89_01360 [Gemmatimonadales bacterium]|nr:hypothetical protein [Gemmatimonadales bacterium]